MKNMIYLLAAIFAFALAGSTQAATTRYWKGGGSDTLWSTGGNWKDGNAPAKGENAHFRADQVSGGFSGKTVTMRDAYSAAVLHVSNGSNAEGPIVFNADQDSSHGVTFTDDGWLGYYAEGALWLKSGTYTFAKSLRVGINANSSGGYSGDKSSFWLKVGDGSSTAVLNAKGTYGPILGKSSKIIADKATLDFTGKAFNMYSSSSLDIKDSEMTAKFINLAVNENNNCKAVFNGGSLTLSASSAIGYGKNSKGYMYATNLTFTTGGTDLLLGGQTSASNTGATGLVDKKGGDWTIGGALCIGNFGNSTGYFTTDGGSVTVGGNTYIAKGSGSTGTLTIKNGTFATKSISATGTATLNMDGCTLKAGADNVNLIDSGITVEVGANGATIDTASCAVTIASAVNPVSGVAGDLSVTGGGSATFSAMGSLTGAFAIGENTALHWFDQDGTVADYAISSLSIAPGATLYLNADTTGGCDTFGTAATNITATSANPATITLVFASAAPAGTTYTLFDTVDGSEFAVVPMLGALELPHEVSIVNGKLTLTITAEDYAWNGSQTNWGDADAWTKGGVSATWTPGNNAIFDTAGREAVLAADAAASEVRFTANATISGESTLAASGVDVASGVTATISAPIGSAFSKTGAGTLVLGTNCTVQTTLSEGTLVMSGSGTTLDWTKLTQGTDVAKPVTVKFDGGATFVGTTTLNVGDQAGMTASLVKEAGDWTVNKLHIGASDSSVASFYHNGGTMVVSGNFDIGQNSSATSSYFEIAGGTVTNSGYYIHLGANSPGVMTVKTGGKYVALGSTGIIVGGNAAGTLNVEGGDVLIYGPLNLSYRGGTTAVNVTDGGLLTINKMLHGTGASGGATAITLDNGTIRANAGSTEFVPNKSNIAVKVGANGGTIDVNTKTIAILRPILEDAESTGGGMTFKGGGVVTLAAGNTYTGTTTVEVGTTVHVAVPGDIGGGLVVTVPETAPADGVYTLLVCDGAGVFTDDVLTGVVAPANSRLLVTTGGKSVVCVYGDGGPVWIGGTSGSLSEASNWANNAVPGAGTNCVIGVGGEATLTVGETFAPSTITFPADTELVTISGERTLSGLASIVNNSSQHHVLAFPIDASAATPTLPLADGNFLVFSGGIALTAMPSVANMRLAGVWNLTGDWTEPPTGTYIVAGSTITVSGMLKSGYNIVVKENATLQVATARANLGADGKNRFLYQNDGTFIVTGEMQDTMTSASGTYSLAGFFANGNNGAVTRANGLVHAASTKGSHIFKLSNSANSATNTIVLGTGGLSFRNNRGTASDCYPFFQIDSGKAVTLASSADWSFGANSVSGKDLCLELVGAVTVDTSDYDDRTVPHIVKAIGRIGSGGTMTVTGCGRLEFEYPSDFYNLYVQDTAIVACNAGCSLTRTAVNVASGATFEVAQSAASAGTAAVTLGGDLTLANNATLAFNFTERGAEPKLAVASGKSMTAAGKVKVKVSGKDSSGNNVWPKGRTYTLTSGGRFTQENVSLVEDGKPDWVKGLSVSDGNIVLTVKPMSLAFYIK